MVAIDKLITGYKDFYHKFFVSDNPLYRELSEIGQSPEILVIACSDSRADPALITNANPGDILVVRNVANLVPPYQPIGDSLHGTSAALEFAVCHLKIENIIVLGHSQCAGIKALIEGVTLADRSFSFIKSWMEVALSAKEKSLKITNDEEQILHCCEREAILISLNNLMSFPWIKMRVDEGKLALHGWYFSVSTGILEKYDTDLEIFKRII